MKRMRAVIDENIPFIKGVLEPYFDVVYRAGSQISRGDVADASALIVRTRTACNRELLEGSKVEFVGSATIGTDHIDKEYCRERGIVVANAPGCNAAAVQQWVLVAIIEWARIKQLQLKGLTLGVVGVGNVGAKVAKSASALGLNILCCDPPRKTAEGLQEFVDIEHVAKNADIITFHVPLNISGKHSTYHTINENFLNSCKPNVLIINTSRGEVGETQAMVDFARRHTDSSFALDVWEDEPHISQELSQLALIATPHIAGYSIQGKVRGTQMVLQALDVHFGLGLGEWQPMPNPLGARVEIANSPSVLDAIAQTYKIMNDDLRHIPTDFESYRNTYPYRNDFNGYGVPDNLPCYTYLMQLGFSSIRSL